MSFVGWHKDRLSVAGRRGLQRTQSGDRRREEVLAALHTHEMRELESRLASRIHRVGGRAEPGRPLVLRLSDDGVNTGPRLNEVRVVDPARLHKLELVL